MPNEQTEKNAADTILSSEQTTSVKATSFKKRLGVIIYFPAILTLVLIMVLTVIFGLTIIIVHEFNIPVPGWFEFLITYFIAPLGSFNNLYDAESSKHLNALTLMLAGLVMAIFVRRCSKKNHLFEIAVVVAILVLVVAMQFIKWVLPDTSEMAHLIAHADKVYDYLEINIVRNSNLAATIIASAIGANTLN